MLIIGQQAVNGGVSVLIPSTVDTIDLSKPFSNGDTSIWGHISKNGTNHNAPTMNDGQIFATDESLFLFGGGISVANPAVGAPTTLPPNGVWQYNFNSSQWVMAITDGSTAGSVPVQRMVIGMSARGASSSKTYYLGGAHAPAGDPYFWTVPGATPYLDQGLLSFDGAIPSFGNFSTSGLNQYGTAAGGFMNLIESVGTQGILVAFGGISDAVGKSLNLTDEGFTDPSLHWNLSSISVYDIGSQTWYQQTANGDIPRWRYYGCSSKQNFYHLSVLARLRGFLGSLGSERPRWERQFMTAQDSEC